MYQLNVSLTQWAAHLLLTSAGPKERAGFILPPVELPLYLIISNQINNSSMNQCDSTHSIGRNPISPIRINLKL